MEPYYLLHKGHIALLAALEGIRPDQAELEHPVGGYPNLKALVSHLAAHERLLEDALSDTLSDAAPTYYLKQYRTNGPERFSQTNIDLRKDHHFEDIMAEMNSSHQHALKSLYLFTPRMLGRKGTVKWHDPKMSLADYIKLAHHDHKIRHAEQILEFKRHLDQISHIPTKK